MPPKVSASKQKRLAEKAARQSAKGSSIATGSTPPDSTISSEASTPITNLSANTSKDDLSSMAKLRIATDRCAYIPALILCSPNLKPPTGVQLVY